MAMAWTIPVKSLVESWYGLPFAFCLMDYSACNLCVFLLYSRVRKELTGNVLMLTGQSHVSQGLIVQVPDSGAEGHFSANESRYSELLLSSHKGPGVSHAGQDTTACESSLPQSSAGRSVSLPEQTLLTQTSGLECSQTGPGERVLAECEVSSASTIRHTSGLQADAGTSRIASGHPVTFSDETGDVGYSLRSKPVSEPSQHPVPEISCESSEYPSRMETDALTGRCDPDDTQVMALFRDWCSQGQRSKKRNKKGDAEKALPVTQKEDSPRVLSSRAVCPSMAGSSAETTRHTPGLQADVGASRTASSHPVTFSDETGEDRYLPRKRLPFRPDQRAVLESAYELNDYPPRRKKEELARILGTTLTRVMRWFTARRSPDNKRNRGIEKGNKKKNTGEALPVTPKEGSSGALSSRTACPSITGLSAETTSHTPDARAASDAGRIAGNYPVTSFDETRPGCTSRRAKSFFSAPQISEFRRLFNEAKGYPDPAEINNLAASLCLDPGKVRMWFYNTRARDKRNNRNDGKNATQAVPGASRTVSSRTAIFSDSKGFRYRSHLSPQQVADCEALYCTARGFPNRKEKDDLADKFGVDSVRIDTWFKNRRMKEAKEK